MSRVAFPPLRTSVALCTCNGAAFVDAQVESLFAQTRAVDEIVAADDASTDDTYARLLSLARRSPVPMRVVRHAVRRGSARNFEWALAQTRGDVVFLCDQDDVWLPDKVAQCLRVFEGDARVMLVHTDATLVDADLAQEHGGLFAALEVSRDERESEDTGRAFEVLLRRNIVTGATAAIRRVVFAAARPFPPDWVHDEWLAVFAAVLGRVVRLDAPLVRYRQHARNQIGALPRTLVEKAQAMIRGATDHQRRQLRRVACLAARLRRMHPPPAAEALAHVHGTLEHASARAELAPARWRRLPRIVRELLNGRYFRYSRGWLSVARDLFGRIAP